jgi:2-keto-4-pentenoate hydratase/2-oxohepta-3-ene-1,7-dioic acid hydratase in catechol pathway
MRLVTFKNEEHWWNVGVIKEDKIVDLSIWLFDKTRQEPYPSGEFGVFYILAQNEQGPGIASTLLQLLYAPDNLLDVSRQALSENESDLAKLNALVSLKPENLVAPIPRPSKNIVCLGRNYAEHAAESRRAFGEAPPPEETPQYPTFFTKAPTAIAGPYADLALDFSISRQYDWECELVFVIGKRGKNIKRDDAMDYVFGYTVLNDITARDVQKRHGGQFFKGKSLDNSCPIGPWIVTRDEIEDPHNLRLVTRVNGIEKQNANTRDMIFDIPSIIESLSQGMTLEPGDIIATGTPAGIGHARTPAEYLRSGDVVECEIEKIGVIRNRIVGEESGQERAANR